LEGEWSLGFGFLSDPTITLRFIQVNVNVS
jgi:hypothetical protein